MTSEQIPDVSIEFIDDSTVRVKQPSGCETETVDLHITQVRYLAERMGLLSTSTDKRNAGQTANEARMARHIRTLAKGINEICGPTPGEDEEDFGDEYWTPDSLRMLSVAFVADLDD